MRLTVFFLLSTQEQSIVKETLQKATSLRQPGLMAAKEGVGRERKTKLTRNRNRNQVQRKIITASVCCQTGTLDLPMTRVAQPFSLFFRRYPSCIKVIVRPYTRVDVVLISRRRNPAPLSFGSLSGSVKSLDGSDDLHYFEVFASFDLLPSRLSMLLSRSLLLLSIKLLTAITPCFPCCCDCCCCPLCWAG